MKNEPNAAPTPTVAADARNIGPMPNTDDRQPDDEARPDGYLESDNEWQRRNPAAVTWLIDNHAAIRAAVSTVAADAAAKIPKARRDGAYPEYRNPDEMLSVAAQPDEQTGLETHVRLFTDAVAQLSTETVDKPVQRMSDAARDVLAERARQVSVERWDTAHDDRHVTFSLSQAAACYAFHACGVYAGSYPVLWPWDYEHWKPTTPRRDLIKAGALILAEIERLDRTVPTK